MTLLEQIFAIFIILGLTAGGIIASNRLYDRGISHYVTRRLAAAFGGVAYLIAILVLSPWQAFVISALLTVAIAYVRLARSTGLRGVGGNAGIAAFPEITYALMGTVSLGVGWLWLEERWLAFVPISFMAWGDTVGGLLRGTLWSENQRSAWPSMAMLVVCLALAALFSPYWIAAVGAVSATVVERLRISRATPMDDNLLLVSVSLSAMAVLDSVVA